MISQGFPVSISTLDSDLFGAVVSVCTKLNIDPSKRLTLQDGATQTERTAADLIRDVLYVSAVGVPTSSDIGIWRSA